jgi:hypothetical protein
MKPIWETLAKNKVDVYLSGHEHNYERMGVMDGIREFVVGTGGRSLYGFGTPLSQSEFRYSENFGVLKLRLFPDYYEWEFVNIMGQIIDSGSEKCL